MIRGSNFSMDANITRQSQEVLVNPCVHSVVMIEKKKKTISEGGQLVRDWSNVDR